ncbi:MAG TPA: hypothetical protein VGN12_29460 [Pirellulales bacterium]|jgi:hypothetical protein
MDGASNFEERYVAPSNPAVEMGATFLAALFSETDTILFRPIETWTEDGKKRSRVDYSNTNYCKAVPHLIKVALGRLLRIAEHERLNLFFGVCPRVGNKGEYDLAWQIRTVRALWTDIDHVTVEEAHSRLLKAGLPLPSISVNSGNGVHLYWLLDTPFQIDDAGDPPPVEIEWSLTREGQKKPRKYIAENGDKAYLDQRRHISRLSPNATLVQDVLAGIADAVGGDHTTDLSRLLRIPGTLNRKDQRNGLEAVSTALVDIDTQRRYSFTTFEPFKSSSPDTKRAKQIAAMPLPKSKRIAASKADKLAELIAACAIAEAGTRSEADFAVCCYAINNGIAKEEVWSEVAQVGKFAEQGQRYFDLTWAKAEFDVRAAMLEKLQRRANPNEIPAVGETSNTVVDEGDDAVNRRPTIVIDPATMPVAESLRQVTDKLLAAGNCFSRADQLVAINGERILPLLAPAELAGLLNQHVEFYFIDGDTGEYRPLPAAYANTWLHHHVERGRLPVITLFTRNPVFSQDWRLVTPGYDSQSGIYYAGPTVEPRDDTKQLDALLSDFCFKSPGDRTNYLGLLLTPLLVPRFIGSKPAALFNGNQPELGKSILAQIIAILRDGHSTETASYNPNDEEFEKRLGAIVRRGITTIIIDNAKSRGRNPRIESACLERSITDPILSFRLLGQSASIRAENSHSFCITANIPDVSLDLIKRSVTINLHHEGNPTHRKFVIVDPETFVIEHRVQILGELIGMVERWKAAGMPMAKTASRFNKRGWGDTVGGILLFNGEPDFLSNVAESARELDDTQRDFAELVSVLAQHLQGKWTAAELADLAIKHGLLCEQLGAGTSRSKATRMGILAGRYVAERFPLCDDREATFNKDDDRNGATYAVYVTEIAERLPGARNV